MKRFTLFLLLVQSFTIAFSQYTIVLQPNSVEGKDVEVIYIYPNSNFGNDQQLNVTTWSNSGVLSHDRSYVDFNFDTIPAGASILSATFYLFNYPGSPTCGGMHQQLTGTNEMEVRRVTSPWSEMTLTWNTQPTWTNLHMIVTPPSTSAHQNYEIDVTTLVQDMIDNPASSYGFGMKLVTESVYRSLIFASSDNTNPALHPKIEITYSLPTIIYVDTCDQYFWATTGQTYTQSGLYVDTLQSINGNDSIVYLDLEISHDTTVSIEIDICAENYYWEAMDDTLNVSGDYMASMQTSAGCDSVIYLSLNLNYISIPPDTLEVISCGPYFWATSGQSYTSSGFYQHTIYNANGCDTVLVLHAIINNEFDDYHTIEACGHYYWNVVGQDLMSSGIYVAQYSTIQGCDSSYTLNLTINESFYDTLEVTACQQYFWPQTGITYLTPGIKEVSFTTSNGCDSIFVLDLQLSFLDIISQPLDQIVDEGDDAYFDVSANSLLAVYQWQYDTGSGFMNLVNNSSVSGSNSAQLIINDVDVSWDETSFRCILSFDNCIDTSRVVYLHVNLGVCDLFSGRIEMFPNPVSDVINIVTNESFNIDMFDLQGKLVYSLNTFSSKEISVIAMNAGIYYLRIMDTKSGLIAYKKIEVIK